MKYNSDPILREVEQLALAGFRPVLGKVESWDNDSQGLATIVFEGSIGSHEVQCRVWGGLKVAQNQTVLVLFFEHQPEASYVVGVLEDLPVELRADAMQLGGSDLQTTLDGKSSTSHNHDAEYVELSGDTMTGALTIQNATPELLLDETDQVAWAIRVGGDQLLFRRNGADIYVVNSSGNMIIKGSLANNDDLTFRLGATKSGSTLMLQSNNTDALEINSSQRVRVIQDFQVDGATVNLANLPTSSAGLNSGDLWNDSGTVKIA